ncbi:hypothetical protein [Limnochorda pilosa]|uniref:Uncharacterized protein n=1 Tax=Limnochorda pilosa TaxID=1555112 RepID=A0A0K2SQG2_LIMPI|nr:hypothetical protein [Limnochorda pilosa]BAS29368.1 hypothetical protein LIP_3557 [Limnochorda pilosa]
MAEDSEDWGDDVDAQPEVTPAHARSDDASQFTDAIRQLEAAAELIERVPEIDQTGRQRIMDVIGRLNAVIYRRREAA